MKTRTITLSSVGAIISTSLFLAGCSEPETVENKEQTQKHGHTHGHHHDHEKAHEHSHTPHMGIVIPFQSGQGRAGFAELKLHDDKGDLELWLTEDRAGIHPFDLPLNSVITVAFPKLDNKVVELRIRNMEKNEDEDGGSNIRRNATNYFIFPGDTGADASFLVGKQFASDAVISFSTANAKYVTERFELKPHTH